MFYPKLTQILYFEETETHYWKRISIQHFQILTLNFCNIPLCDFHSWYHSPCKWPLAQTIAYNPWKSQAFFWRLCLWLRTNWFEDCSWVSVLEMRVLGLLKNWLLPHYFGRGNVSLLDMFTWIMSLCNNPQIIDSCLSFLLCPLCC